MTRPALFLRFRRTIAGKLLLVVLPCLLVGMAAMYAGFETYGRHERIAALKARLDSFAVTQGASLVKPLWEFDEDQLDRLVRSYARVPELLAVEIRDAKGAVVATARGDGTDGHGEVFRRTLDLVQHAPDGDYTVGRLSVAFHDGVVRRELAGQRTAGAVLLLGAFVLLAGGMLFAVRRFVATPLRELQDSLHRNATLETRELLHWRHQDELGEVVYAYNQLLGEVNQHIGDVYRLAFYDPLTGLPNRRLLEDRLGHAIALAERQGRDVAVLFIDIDRFKVINDTLGHKLGDDVLRTVAERLRGSLRSMDTITRWGGDEFVVIIEATETGASAGQASSISEKLLDLIGQPVSIGDNLLRISASVGISLFPQDGRDVTTLIKNADMALYEAKGAGRNAFRFFDQAMNLRAVRRLEIEALLRQAIERDELELHYQPKLATAGGRLEGVEALVRWRRGPDLVPPDQFIPVAEESDLIIDIGRWVLARACAQIQAWRAAGLGDIQVAINLSPRHLRCAQDVDDLAAIVERSGVPPSLIEIELTESCIMEDPERAADFLRHLRDRGFAIAIDDFGTGYSSLSHLRRLPITALKIDRSFVNAIEDATEDAEIVRTIIAMANTLSLGIVAEGVETRGQLDFLCQAGCAVVQGYYFARPMPPRDFERWMRGRFRMGLRTLGDSWANGAAEDRAFGGAGEGLGMAYP